MLKRTVAIFTLLLTCLFLLIDAENAAAFSAKDQFFKAESCYKILRNNPGKIKYRDNWLRCIDEFSAVYKKDPSGPWAAAGLYKAGELYQELYKYSFKAADIKEALDLFERVSRRYPDSSYKAKADAKIKALTRSAKKKQQKPSTSKEFAAAESCYKTLRNNPGKIKYRDNWLRCIEKFSSVYENDPTGPWAAAGLYKAGELYLELYKHSYRSSDKKEAITILHHLIKDFPDSEYRAMAEGVLGISGKRNVEAAAPALESNRPGTDTPDDIAAVIEKSSLPTDVTAKTDETPGDQKTSVTDLRFWSNPNYTRIVIDTDSETTYQHRLLNEDPTIQKPQRLYIDLDRTILGKDTSKIVPINDNLLSDVRAGQYTLETVRVVVDIKSFNTYKIFSLKNPFRIVIDIWGAKEESARQSEPVPKTDDKDKEIPASALAKQLALGVRRIVIDPGHGGRDYGAPGYLRGVHEKHVVLTIGKKLAKKIEQKLGCKVILTREDDRHLTLEERTAIANTESADLFISIHTNSARDRRAYGIETYFLNLATDDEAIRVAAMENATSTKNISDLQTILNDLMHNAKVNESSRLAAHVQEALYLHMKRNFSRIKNKGVKQAPFYVLLGAQMPSILIETSFISNSRECKRLNNPDYQDHLTDAIVKGIRQYIKETNPTAFSEPAENANIKG